MIDDLIFDVGAHNGDDTAHYLSRGFRVVAVEANPTLAAALEERFAGALAERRLDVVKAGVGPEFGRATFWVNPQQTEFSAFAQEIAGRGAEPVGVDVEVVTFRSLLERYGVPYYLKVDIERHDSYCLAAHDPADLPAYVSVEAHTIEYLDVLRGLGYGDFKCVDQSAHLLPATFSNATRSGRAAHTVVGVLRRIRARMPNRRFAPGSSGPFGEETPGHWQTYSAASDEWRAFNAGERRGHLNPRGWFDFHARLPLERDGLVR